jgi:D-serine dehydratase
MNFEAAVAIIERETDSVYNPVKVLVDNYKEYTPHQLYLAWKESKAVAGKMKCKYGVYKAFNFGNKEIFTAVSFINETIYTRETSKILAGIFYDELS